MMPVVSKGLFVIPVSALLLAAPAAAAEPCAEMLRNHAVRSARVVYIKAKKRLCYYSAGKLLFTAPASYGSAEGKKRFQGDKKTPEGRYRIAPARKSKKYGLFMHLSYPNAQDRTYAKRRGRPAGSAVGIHGPPRAFVFLGSVVTWFNATDGCIMLKEADMLRFAGLVKRPTQMVILSR